jgi:MFS family permease
LPGFRVVGGGASVLDVGGSVGGEVGALVVAGSVVAGIVIGGRTVVGEGGGGAGMVVVGALVAGVEVDGSADVDVVVDELTTCWSVDTDLESSPHAASASAATASTAMNLPGDLTDDSLADRLHKGMRGRLRDLLSPGSGPPFRDIVRSGGWYPLTILVGLNTVDELERAVLGIFGPNIKRYFGIDNATLGAIVGVQVLAVVLLAVPVGYLGTKIDRARILQWSVAIWSAFSVAIAFAVSLPLFFLGVFGIGVSKSSSEPVGKSLLTDYYPPMGWNRVLAAHSAANPFGQLLGPLFAGVVALFVAGDGVWRVAFPLLAIPSVLMLFASLRLHEPENQMVRGLTGGMITVTGAPSGLPFREAVRKLVRIPTFKRQLIGIGVLGFGLVGMLTFFNLFLEEQYGIDETGRAVIGVIIATAALLGTLIGGNVGERIFATDPRRAVQVVGLSIAGFSVAVGAAVFLPNVWVFVPAAWIGMLALSIGTAPLYAILSAICAPRLRPLMFSLLGVFIALFGGITGGIVVGLIADATSVRVGLATLAPTGIVGGLLMMRGCTTVNDDIAAVQAETLDDPLAQILGNL